MLALQIVAIVISLGIAGVGTAMFVKAIQQMLAVVRMGAPASRGDNKGSRAVTLLKESLGHTRMLQWGVVGAAHWFIFVGFGLLFFTLLTAFGQLFDAEFALPLVGHFFPYEWATEFFTMAMIIAIVGLLGYRLTRPTERVRGTRGRLYGSTMWQGYFVEAVILGVGLCIVTLRGLEYAMLAGEGSAGASALHFPFTFWLGEIFAGASYDKLAAWVWIVATAKIVISFTWMIVISLNTTMGVAWHRFTAWFNIFFKRESSGRTALGAVKPLTIDGKAIGLDDIDALDEESPLGVGAVEQFSWKAILDFTSCTECGRCQSQCPAWNTDKPLSPKLLITALRDHAYATAPYLLTAEGDRDSVLAAGGDTLTKEVERPLVGPTGDDWFYMPEDGSAVIDPDVLWNCTSCGACVQQCPVDIEHVDHIIDMRRHQILVESNFPSELNALFKGLESKGNPWNMSPKSRMEWANGLEFEVPVVGETLESLDTVDWLFWVGCAGAYEDRAKKTTRAVAELLNIAGISFGVLGNGETCTGDPARRAGNEFVFQTLATENAETLLAAKAKKVVSTCAHCFNTLKNEYAAFGVELEVVHHTQLLNKLVREGKLTPVATGDGAAKRSITYHDPCYLGRHNQVYTPPRELLAILPGAEVIEMERNSERSFCCGAGGARLWMEENIGERINVNRTTEAVGTGADQIAVGCPFCRVMLSDGLTAMQATGDAREEVEVLDVAQMLLASVKGETATKPVKPAPAKAGAGAPAAGSGAGGAVATGSAAPVESVESVPSGESVETKAEPEPGDVTITDNTVTETADAGPLAKASGGASLFDNPAPAESAKDKPASGGSLFDTPAETKPAASGSLFDTPTPAAAEPAEPAEPAESKPAAGGSLFDVAPTETAAAPTPATPEETKPASSGSLFDVAPTETESASSPVEPERTDDAKPATGGLFDVTPIETEPDPPPVEPVDTKPAAGGLFDVSPAARGLFDVEETPAPATPTEPAPPAAPAAPAAPAVRGLFDVDDTPPPIAPASGSTDEATPAPPSEDADPDATLDSDDEVDVPAADADSSPAAPASPTSPATADETKQPDHQPKSDADITQAMSLFDL